jgi:5-methylcytosine-specific restriction enzyme subunit McrC
VWCRDGQTARGYEFDLITCNKDYEDDPSLKYLKEEIFIELENFILVFNESEEADAMDFFKVGVRRNVGKVIQAKNYVGLIQMKSGFQIQVLPKISCN